MMMERSAERHYLTEFGRKIYLERQGEFEEHARGNSASLEIPSVTADDSDAVLSILYQKETRNIREARFSLELEPYGTQEFGDMYEFGYVGTPVLRKMSWIGESGYHQVSQDDEVGQEEVYYDIDRTLRASGVEPPVTNYQEEKEFWQLASGLYVQDVEERGLIKPGQFEIHEDEDRMRRMKLAYATLRRTMSAPEYSSPFTLHGAIHEDIARYVSRRVESNSRQA